MSGRSRGCRRNCRVHWLWRDGRRDDGTFRPQGFLSAVYDAAPAVLARFAMFACRRAASPADAARGARILYHARCRCLVHASGAALSSGPEGRCRRRLLDDARSLIQTQTADAAQTYRPAADPRAAGRALHRRPGGPHAARGGGGAGVPASTAGRRRPAWGGGAARVRGAWLSTIVHVGPRGTGIRLKLVNNYSVDGRARC